jgi:hypothetical protein
MNRQWWTPLTGVAFVVLVIVGIAIQGEAPDVDESAQAIVDHYSDNADAVRIGTLITAWAVVLWLFFAGTVRRVLRAAEGAGHTLSAVAFGGAVIFAVGAAIDGMISFALAESAEDIDPVAVQALAALWENDFLPFVIGLATFLLATGLSIIRHGALPKWLGWIAIVLGVVALTPVGFVAFLASALWVIAASVVLTLRERGGGGPASPAAPEAPTVA